MRKQEETGYGELKSKYSNSNIAKRIQSLQQKISVEADSLLYKDD